MERIILSLFGLIVICQVHAAQPFAGMVTDTNGHSISYATVVLLHDGAQAAGATTDSLGHFILSALPGTYTLQLRHLSYLPAEYAVTVRKSVPSSEVFRMNDLQVEVKEIVVSASSIIREADRFVVTVSRNSSFAYNFSAGKSFKNKQLERVSTEQRNRLKREE